MNKYLAILTVIAMIAVVTAICSKIKNENFSLFMTALVVNIMFYIFLSIR